MNERKRRKLKEVAGRHFRRSVSKEVGNFYDLEDSQRRLASLLEGTTSVSLNVACFHLLFLSLVLSVWGKESWDKLIFGNYIVVLNYGVLRERHVFPNALPPVCLGRVLLEKKK